MSLPVAYSTMTRSMSSRGERSGQSREVSVDFGSAGYGVSSREGSEVAKSERALPNSLVMFECIHSEWMGLGGYCLS